MTRDPRFCVNLKINEGWINSIALNLENGILRIQTIVVDYDSLTFRCRVCLSWKHGVEDCKDAPKQPKGPRKPTHALYNQPCVGKKIRAML